MGGSVEREATLIADLSASFQRKPRIDERAADCLGVFFRNTACTHGFIPGGFYLILHVGDDLAGVALLKQKPCMLRKDVLCVRIAAQVTAIKR